MRNNGGGLRHIATILLLWLLNVIRMFTIIALCSV